MRHFFDYFLNPKSVALIGASTVLHKAGGRRWRSMVEAGFAGPVYPVHPTAREILGRKAYRSIRDIPGEIELAVILVRPELVPEAVADCATLRIPAVVVITAGFGETGVEGKRVERELAARLREAGSRMIGPNCAGLFSASGRVNVLGWGVPSGPVALISQSGNMALTFAQLAREKGLGFSQLVTVGNAADLQVSDCLDYLFTDPETSVIVAYLEGFEPLEGSRLCTLVRNHPAPKPVIVLKPGETASGRRAALSHTGALASENRVVDAAFRQAGILRVVDTEEVWDAAIALASLPRLNPGTVVVISDGGGHATIVSDSADRAGLGVPELPEKTQAALRQVLPARSAVINPVDFAGQAEEEPQVVPRVLDICLADPEIGGAIFAGHFGGYFKIATEELGYLEEEAARELVEVVRQRGKPVIVHTIYGAERLPALETLRSARIPIHRSLEASAKAMANLWGYSRLLQRPRASSQRRSRPDAHAVSRIMGRATGAPPRLLLEPDARELVASYGVPVPPFDVVASSEEAMRAARRFGQPVALKLVTPGLVHKSDIGGVLLDVRNAAAAKRGYKALVEAARRAGLEEAKVLVTPMVRDSIETVIGAFRDPQFGPVVMFGIGGIFVEALGDVVFRLAPLDQLDAEAMIREVRAGRLLDGMRGRPARDVASLVDALIRVSELAADRPEVAELDLNPVFLLANGAAVGDARVILG